jgi:hypothetical protein
MTTATEPQARTRAAGGAPAVMDDSSRRRPEGDALVAGHGRRHGPWIAS